jgi:signal transduction histidine kinase
MEAAPAASARIAICEDERIVALDLANFLNRSGHQVVGLYASAEALLEAVETTRPDLVLMDIHLQGSMDGVEAAAILHAQWAIPVILLTAFADGPTIERAKLSHPYAYILKPYDDRELRTAIAIGLYRASMEARLRTSELRYRSLFNEALSAIFLVDAAGRVVEGNRAFHKMIGAVTNLDSLLPAGELSRRFMELLDGGAQVPSTEIAFKTPEGSLRWLLLSAAPFPLVEGNACYQFQAMDITERKAMYERLFQVQKMEALGRLAGGVAHDFNNILTAVMGYARLLRMQLDEAGIAAPELGGIEESARRAANLTRQLLAFSRGSIDTVNIFSLNKMIDDLRDMISRLLGDDISLRIHHTSHAALVCADRSRLEQVVINLVVNARDAMPKGGCITVVSGVRDTDAPAATVLGTMPDGAWSWVRISDTGEGIDPALLTRIFEPFFSTKPHGKGTGLGLSTVADVVRQHDGWIDVESMPGEGSDFSVFLPRAAGSPLPDIAMTSTVRSGIGHGELVLLVENDETVRAITELSMERHGYRVISASNPGAALLMVERPGCAPAVLITNVVMPLMHGPELASRLRSSFPELPVIFLVADPDSLDELANLGDAHSITKPYPETELLSALQEVLAGKVSGSG